MEKNRIFERAKSIADKIRKNYDVNVKVENSRNRYGQYSSYIKVYSEIKEGNKHERGNGRRWQFSKEFRVSDHPSGWMTALEWISMEAFDELVTSFEERSGVNIKK